MNRELRTMAWAGAVLLGAALPAAAQTPLGSAFTYQGRLTDQGAAANGPHDFEVKLFTAPAGGVQAGPTIVRDDVAVANGLFAMTLDFGPGPFAGSARWLEIGVRPGAGTGPFTAIAPRQELTPSPNALFSAVAPWTGLLGVPAGFADGVDNDSGGDITGVTAGFGLSGGAASGEATLSVDTTAIQARVNGTCAPGQSIRTVNAGGTVVCEPDDVGWALGGNTGTNPTVDFIGTADAQPLVFRANNVVALRLSQGPVLPNVLGGSTQNAVSAGVDGATIAGGGGGTAPGANRVTDQYGAVGGGYANVAGDDAGTATDRPYATVGGGFTNRASGSRSTVAGGTSNVASGTFAAVGGGETNVASGSSSTVAGGAQNVAGGDQSLAGGFRARVRDAAASGDSDGDEGTFVWADVSAPFGPFVSTGPNQFLVRATGGVGINTNAPAFPLDVDGVIRSRTGGFRFPDGTTQTTAATGIGDITSVNTPIGGGLTGGTAAGDASLTLLTCSPGSILKRLGGNWGCALDDDSGGTVTSVTAGTGLTGGTITTSGTIGVSFAGTGSQATVSRSDHDHVGQAWTGTASPMLQVSTSGSGAVGFWGQTAGVDGSGVLGWATATSGASRGVFGQTESTTGRAVEGLATSTVGATFGVWGDTASPSGAGVVGRSTTTAGIANGVMGVAFQPAGIAVLGIALNTGGFASAGVRGSTASTAGRGVWGDATATSGGTTGVYGTTVSPVGIGVFGGSTATTNVNYGVYGTALSSNGRGVYGQALATSGQAYGVYGISFSSGSPGIYGTNNSTVGLADGIWGTTFGTAAVGVQGVAYATTGNNVGMLGGSYSTSGGIGVMGQAAASTGTNYGIFGTSFGTAGYAGFFLGRVQVTGTLSKGGGAFKIDHPLDPENKYLYHSFVESPDMKNIYDGMVTTDADGFATVEMPDWFEALNRDFRYQLTVIGDGAWARARVFRKLADRRFVIQTDLPSVEVSWQLTGIRHDPFAEKHRIPVEEEKDDRERGKYLHPDAWEQPAERGLDHGLTRALAEPPAGPEAR